MIDEYIQQVRRFSRIKPRVIAEIGAYDAAYSRHLQQVFQLSPADIYLVEANPELDAVLERSFPGANRLMAAIAAQTGSTRFNRVSWPSTEAPCSSVLERQDSYGRALRYEPAQVDTLSGKDLMAKIGRPIDMCIIDVEGLAYEALSSFGPDLQHVRSLMIECEHTEVFKGQRLFEDVRELLTGAAFRQMAFKYSYANQSDSVWIQERYVDLELKTVQ